MTKKTPLTSLINVEGVIASQTLDVKIEGGENPLKRIRKTIDFNQIPKDKRGVYLIEILGNGTSTRIIIKKGRLNLNQILHKDSLILILYQSQIIKLMQQF